MLLGSLIGPENQASPQLPSRLCPGMGSQALLILACRYRRKADTPVDQGVPDAL